MSGCKITRASLDKIWNLAKEGFSSEAHVRITTERMAGELWSEIEGNTIDGVIETVRSATLPGNPDAIHNLRLSISERDAIRSVSITIGGHLLGPRVNVSVKDENPTWVRGRVGGLRDLFAETRTEWFFGHGRIRFLTAFLGFSMACALNMPISSIPLFGHYRPAEIMLFIAGFGILTGGGYRLGAWIDRRSQSELRLQPPDPKRAASKIDIGVWALLVTIIGVVVAIISALASHHVFPPIHVQGSVRQGVQSSCVLPPTDPGLAASWGQAGLGWAQAGVSWAQAADGPMPAGC